ncbi:hypothetical protein [uncultured Fibrobacter sp.]|uniref:hypothetical protein n=1 Tax=uncultured Fibrobacter sp. TaxID=261512 RepID=UPI0025F090A6|nr:hypothetical protein [uncultured Fibrobacter sp.]
MKKLISIIVMACALLGYAQDSSIKPEFQAFSGALVKLKKAKNGYHKFMLDIVAAPWAFKAEGEVAAPGGDPDMLINALFDGDLYAVLAYVPSATSGTDGQEYQVGLFDMMLFFEDEPTKIRNLKFTLLPPANDDWAMSAFNDAQSSGTLLGKIWKGKYDREITKASANPLTKQSVRSMQRAAEEAAAAEEAERQAKMAAKKSKKKKKKASIVDECDDPDMTVKEKRRCQMKAKNAVPKSAESKPKKKKKKKRRE